MEFKLNKYGMIKTPSDDFLNKLSYGDFEDNEKIDTACAKRLLSLCNDYGNDGKEAEEFLRKIQFSIFYVVR